MVYKNGTKDFLLAGFLSLLFFGLSMGLWYMPIIGSFFVALVYGLVSGLIFAILFVTFIIVNSKYIERKSKLLRKDILKYRKVICDGPATYGTGLNGSGGWLFLSEDALEFYAHKVNFVTKNIPILLNEIQNIETKFNKLVITTNKDKYVFIVQKCKLWKKSISEVL